MTDKQNLNAGQALSYLEAANRIDELADQFESDLINGITPDVENLLNQLPNSWRCDLLREILLLESEYQQQRGENLDFTSYKESLPKFKDLISEVQHHIKFQKRQRQSTEETIIGQGDTANISSEKPLPLDEEIDFLHPPVQPDEMGRLGGYRILQVMGVGGMGIVFRAEDPKLKRQIALKAMKPSIAAIKSAKERFIREAQSTAAIEHYNIVHIYQVAEDGNIPFIAMQFLRGESLKDRLERGDRIDQVEILKIGKDVAAGLVAAHERGLIHRDIKPDNIWIEKKSGSSKILDFGLVRNISENDGLTQSGLVLGTPQYMAPEQAQGLEVDYRCDLFSLGSVLYELATGTSPFEGKNVTSTLMAVSYEEPEPVNSLNPDINTELADLIMRLLTKERDQRPQSASAVLHTLNEIKNRIKAQPGNSSSAGTKKAPAPQKQSGRNGNIPFQKTLIAAAAAFLLFAGIVFLIKTSKGTVKITVSDPNADISINVDGELINLSVLDKPLQLKVGNHNIEVKGEGYNTFTKLFTVTSGDNPPVNIELVPDQPVVQKPQSDRSNWQPGSSPEILPGLIPQPAKLSSAKRWQLLPLSPTRHPNNLVHIKTSPKSNFIAIPLVGYIYLHQLPSFDLVQVLNQSDIAPNSNRIRIAWSPDEKMIASISELTCSIWDVSTGNLISTWEIEKTDKVFNSLCWNPEGDKLVTVQYWEGDDAIKIWTLNGKLIKTLNHAGPNSDVTWSKNGKYLACASDPNLTIWDTNTWEEVHQINLEGNIGCAAWSPDSQWLACGSSDNIIHIFQTGSWEEDRQIKDHISFLNDLNWSSDGNYLVSAGQDTNAILWDMKNDKKITSYHHFLNDKVTPVYSSTFSSDDKWMISVGLDGIRSYNIDQKKQGDFFAMNQIERTEQENGNILLNLPETQQVIFSKAGQLISGDLDIIDKNLICLIEQENGLLIPVKPSVFLKSNPQDFKVSKLSE